MTEKSLCGEEKFYAIQQDAFQWKYCFVYMRHVCFGYISRAITENCLPFKTELATVLPLRLKDFFSLSFRFFYTCMWVSIKSEVNFIDSKCSPFVFCITFNAFFFVKKVLKLNLWTLWNLSAIQLYIKYSFCSSN